MTDGIDGYALVTDLEGFKIRALNSIEEIKIRRQEEALKIVQEALDLFNTKHCCESWLKRLFKVSTSPWTIEDLLRDQEKRGYFDAGNLRFADIWVRQYQRKISGYLRSYEEAIEMLAGAANSKFTVSLQVPVEMQEAMRRLNSAYTTRGLPDKVW